MPTQQDYQTIFADPTFRALPGYVKIAKLKEYDPDFAALPQKEQVNAVFGLLNPGAQRQIDQSADKGKGVGETIADTLGGAALSIVHPIEAFKAASRAQEEQRQKAVQAEAEGNTMEAFSHRLAAGLPVWIGPPAAQAGEDIGSGKTAQGLTEAGMMLAPSAVAAGRAPIKAGGSFIKGAAEATPAAVKKAATQYGPYITPIELLAGAAGLEKHPAVAAALGAAGFLPALPDIFSGGMQAARESWNRYPYPAGPVPGPPVPPPPPGDVHGPPNFPLELTPPPGQYYNWENAPQEHIPFPPPLSRVEQDFAASQAAKGHPSPVDITGTPFARGTATTPPAAPPPAAPGAPLPRQPWNAPTQQPLPLQEPPVGMQRIGMHHIVKFSKDNGIPFESAKQLFANEGYVGDWDVMGP